MWLLLEIQGAEIEKVNVVVVGVEGKHQEQLLLSAGDGALQETLSVDKVSHLNDVTLLLI